MSLQFIHSCCKYFILAITINTTNDSVAKEQFRGRREDIFDVRKRDYKVWIKIYGIHDKQHRFLL